MQMCCNTFKDWVPAMQGQDQNTKRPQAFNGNEKLTIHFNGGCQRFGGTHFYDDGERRTIQGQQSHKDIKRVKAIYLSIFFVNR